MPTSRAGEIVLLAFPFTDGTGVKHRTALILLDAGENDLLARTFHGTEHLKGGTGYQPVPVGNLPTETGRTPCKKETQLSCKDTAPFRQAGSLVERSLGRLQPDDWRNVRTAIAQWQSELDPRPDH